MDAFKALALQLRCDSVNSAADPAEARGRMAATLGRLEVQLDACLKWLGPETRLVVLPEYFLSGFPMGESPEQWKAKACLSADGEEYAKLGKIASRLNLYLSGNAYELDEHFEELYFQCSFIIAPSGETILRYRRLNSMFAPTPHDVWDQYLERYGYEGVFPVARTEIGNLACIASEEILYPEIARALAMRGAEIFLHSSSEASSPLPTPKKIARAARAIENLAYVVSANSAGIDGIAIPAESTNGYSAIVDYRGDLRVEAGQGESVVANAEIDLAGLRRHRRRPGMENYLSRQRMELFAATYANSVYPANSLAQKKPERSHYLETQRRVIQKLAIDEII